MFKCEPNPYAKGFWSGSEEFRNIVRNDCWPLYLQTKWTEHAKGICLEGWRVLVFRQHSHLRVTGQLLRSPILIGHDFLIGDMTFGKLGTLSLVFPSARIVALTATATKDYQSNTFYELCKGHPTWNIGRQSMQELFCSCQREVRTRLWNECASTKVR